MKTTEKGGNGKGDDVNSNANNCEKNDKITNDDDSIYVSFDEYAKATKENAAENIQKDAETINKNDVYVDTDKTEVPQPIEANSSW